MFKQEISSLLCILSEASLYISPSRLKGSLAHAHGQDTMNLTVGGGSDSRALKPAESEGVETHGIEEFSLDDMKAQTHYLCSANCYT